MLHWHVVKLRRVLGTIDAVLDTIDPLRGLKKKLQPKSLRAHIEPMLETTALLS
jgi:hypothetical protein